MDGYWVYFRTGKYQGTYLGWLKRRFCLNLLTATINYPNPNLAVITLPTWTHTGICPSGRAWFDEVGVGMEDSGCVLVFFVYMRACVSVCVLKLIWASVLVWICQLMCHVMIPCDALCHYDRPVLPIQHTQRRSAPIKSASGGEGRERAGNGAREYGGL